MKTRVLFALLLFPCVVPSGQSPAQWTEIRNAHFEIYSQAGDDAARKALVWFERLRAAFLEGSFLPEIAIPPDLPVLRVIGFSSPEEYAKFQLRSTADAYFAGTAHRDYIVMPSLDPHRFAMASHEYAHFILHASGLKMPDWLSEGVAEYFSTLQYVGHDAFELGGDLPASTQTLHRERPIPLDELLAFKLESSVRRSHQELERFYAQSWALADMLLTSSAYRSHLAGLIDALNSGGMSGPGAFTQVYGKSLDAVNRDVSAWLTQNRRKITLRMNPPEPAVYSSFAATTLSADQAMALLADLLLAAGNLDRARTEYSAMARQIPRNPEVHAALGNIAFNKGERAEAFREWRLAMDDGLNDADLCFRFALIADEAGAPQSQIIDALIQAIALRPRFDDARFKLALIESNAGNYLAAIDQLRAMQVPHGRRAYGYWTALAYAFTQIDKRNDALAAAREALSEARTEDERQRAQQLAYVASTDLKAQFFRDSQGRLQVTTTRVEHGATRWNPFVEPTDQMRRKNGQLSDVLCTAGKLTGFRVLTTGGSLILDVPDPSHVLIENGPNEYYCGVMQKKAVRVDYAVLGSAGAGKNILRGMTFGDGPEK